jgi:outer membrane protein
MLKRVILLIVFTMGLFLGNAWTQEANAKTFSLKEAQNYALENNIEVRNKILDIELARKKVWETTTIGLPQISGSGAYQQFLDIPTQLIPAEFFGGDPGTFIPVKFGTKHNANFGLTASMLLFNGEYIVGLQASKIFLELSSKGLTQAENEIKESVAKSYYLVLVAQESRKILTQSLENMSSIQKEMEEILKAGMIEDTDVDQMRLTVANLENSLKSLENQIGLAERLLKFQMGLDLEEKIILSESLEQILLANAISPSLSKTFNVTSNIDFQLLETSESLQKMNLRRQQSAFLPTLSAFGSFSRNAYRTDFNFFEGGGKWFPTNLVGLQLSVPIFSSGMRLSKVNQAKIELEKIQNTKQQVEQGLELAFEQTRNTLKTSRDKLETERESLNLSENIYNKTIIKYKEGISSSMDLTMAQNQYLTTQGNYLSAMVELLNAKAELDKILSEN